MSRLDQLPEITDHVLSGLRADDSLKYRIYQKAAGASENRERKSYRLPLAALCAISAVMIAVFVFLGRVSPIAGGSDSSRLDITASQETESSHVKTINAGGEFENSPLKNESENEKASSSENQEDSEDKDEQNNADKDQQ